MQNAKSRAITTIYIIPISIKSASSR